MAKSKRAKSASRTRTARAGSGGAKSNQLKGAGGGRSSSRVSAQKGQTDVFGHEVAGKFREPGRHEWRRVAFYVLSLAMFVLFDVYFVVPRRGWTAAFVLGIAFAWTMVAFNSRNYAYRCANCKTVFQVPVFVNFFTMTWRGRRPDGTSYSYKNLTCPHCHARTKARIVSRVDLGREQAKRRGGSKEPRLLS